MAPQEGVNVNERAQESPQPNLVTITLGRANTIYFYSEADMFIKFIFTPSSLPDFFTNVGGDSSFVFTKRVEYLIGMFALIAVAPLALC